MTTGAEILTQLLLTDVLGPALDRAGYEPVETPDPQPDELIFRINATTTVSLKLTVHFD